MRIIKTVLYLAGGLAAVAFLITKNAAALAWATSDAYRYGDIYRLAQVKRFKPAQPLPSGRETNDSIDQGRQLRDTDKWIFLGDSFSVGDYGDSAFPSQLGRNLGGNIFRIYNNHHMELWSNPFLLLRPVTNPTATPHILFYEIAERLIEQQFSTPVRPDAVVAKSKSATANPLFRSLDGIRQVAFSQTELRHEDLLKHSFVTAPVVSLWNSAAFECFRQMSPEVPLYSLDPPFLFFRDEVTCFQSEHGDHVVTTLADNIALLDKDLRARCNCVLVFIPIPNKISVYSRLATNKPYDDFVPRLCAALKTRGVSTVELMDRYRREQEILYWPTDTHWNALGIRIAVQETLSVAAKAASEAEENQSLRR